MDKEKEALNVEASKLNYRLRSTFFLRKIREYDAIKSLAILKNVLSIAASYSWQERDQWCIQEESFPLVSELGLNPLEVFCHPKVILEFMALISYYRNVAALSQKAAKYLSGIDVTKWEINESKNFSHQQQNIFGPCLPFQ